MSTIKQIGMSMTNNDLSMRFALQLRMDFQHPQGMKWNINIRNTGPCHTNNGVTSCPPWRRKITESNLRIKSKDLKPLSQRHKILTSMHPQRFPERRRQGLISYHHTSTRVRKNPIIKVIIIAVCCERRME